MKNKSYRVFTRDPFSTRINKASAVIGVTLLSAVTAVSAFGQGNSQSLGLFGRDIDTRLINAPSVPLMVPNSSQVQIVESMRQSMPDILATYNEYGTTSSLTNATGNLTAEVKGKVDTKVVASGFVDSNLNVLGLVPGDVSEMQVTDVVQSISGVTHYYYGQTYQGLPVYNAQLQVHVTDKGAISLVNNGFVPRIADSVTSTKPQIGSKEAVVAAADFLNIELSGAPIISRQLNGSGVELMQAELSPEAIKAKLVLMPMGIGRVEPAWNFQFRMDKGWPDITVNALSGELITSFDMMRDAQYRVYEQPTESPIHTSPAPPNDARTLVNNPEDSTASPNGWLGSGNVMDGNNVSACADRNGNNSCDTPRPVCSGGSCDFSLNLSANPANSLDAAIANLFYWNNVIHDVQYQYGFDERGGNFQEDNFGRGGAGSDSVNAEAQDNASGGSNCNANFSTPTDGGNPRMQMFLCNRGNPAKDGDFDNGVIVHEYGHGISIRQVGGPSTSSCLNNRQQAGEGWSDWLAVAYTAEAGDRGTDARGVGSYLFNFAPDGTIRPQRYSTDPSVNNYTYASVAGKAVPHGVGSVWAQVAWEMYWALVDKHGFEGDLVNFDLSDSNEAGNKRALFYVNEGFKNTACRPTFVDNRDGIIAAATNSFSGEDVCTIWKVFAAYGLGVNAVSGGSNGTNPTNGFNLPSACEGPDPDPDPEPPACDGELYKATFESGSDRWTAGNSSCTTGTFVRGEPTLVTAGGVTTQVGGASVGNGAWFTAPNTAAGTNDVDGGTCETLSPVVDASGETSVEVSLDYFHGQRDAGDDAEDGLVIDVLNNGSVAATMVDLGDETSNASWANASVVVGNPGNIQIRVRATDGSAGGDLIEAGIDQVLVCPSDTIPDPDPDPGPGDCAAEVDFENGAEGWSNSGASSCSTGSYVVGTPTAQSNGGVTTQVGGANSGSGAYFTATNTGAGTNDVDGGNCIAESPNYDVSEASGLSVAYFHGQRDAGDDVNGDFFRLEYSLNGGASFQSLASNGDTTSNAAWQTATASIPAGSNVQLRVQCSDGASGGDLVECGIDDVKICPRN